MKRPFLHIFIFYIVGIIFYSKFNIDIELVKLTLLISIFLLVMTFIFKTKANLYKYVSLVSLFLIGIIVTANSIQKNQISKLYNENVNSVGVIKEVLSKEEGYEKYILDLEKIKHKGKVYVIDEKITYNIYGSTDIEAGDRIIGELSIKEPNRNTNPKLFNYRLHLQSKNIFATASSKDYNVKVLNRDNLNLVEKVSIKVKKDIVRSLDTSLKPENSNILKSIILGDDSFLDEDYIKNFRKLGLSHILAVSGLHIGVIFGTIIFILDLFKIHRRNSMMISIAIIWFYACLIGFPPSVLRSSLMFSFLTIGNLSFSRYDSVNTVSLSGFLMLLYRPLWIFSVGFQLSFTATFAILIFMPQMNRIIKIKNKSLKSALVIILTAQLGVLPISLYYFNEMQTLSIISNLIVAPVLTVGIIIGFLIVLSSAISIKISILIGVLGNFILNIVNTMTIFLSKMTSLNIWTSSPSLIEIFFYYLAIFILLEIIDIKKMNKNIQNFLYLNFAIIIIYSCVLQLNQETISVEFIDVGQGDSCLVRLKDKNLLVDTGGNAFGNFDIGENILLPYLRKTGVKTIDGVFISHFHADHCKGLLPLFGEIDLKNIFIGYKSPEEPLYQDIMSAAKEYDVKVNLIKKGDILKLDSNNYIEVLEPLDDEMKYSGENDNSLVFILSVYSREILFTGDIEDKGEDRLIDASKKRNIDILKVPHHGSKTSSKREFIKHFNPKIAVIQLGKNSFGHPNEDVLNRYYENNTKILRNDHLGLITAIITKDKMSLEGYLKNKQTFLDYIMQNKHIMIYLIYGCVILIQILLIEVEEWDIEKF